jgi:putative peptidoglycan lipid II flippase
LIVAFYARKDTRTPVAIGVVTVLLYLISALVLIGPLDVAGLALANAIQNSAHGLILLALLERAGARLIDGAFALWTLRVLLASVLLGGALWLANTVLLPAVDGTVALAVVLGAMAAGAVLVYLALLEMLGVRDGRQVLAVVLARVSRPRSA